jgi:phosphoribosylanthranilate isomerase
LDADAAGTFGGTGQAADWTLIANQRAMLGDRPLILAGGLTPANVGQAIAAVRPGAVDVASGVEHHPGLKDHGSMKQFVEAARQAFARD